MSENEWCVSKNPTLNNICLRLLFTFARKFSVPILWINRKLSQATEAMPPKAPQTCYICGEAGHVQAQCPKKGSRPAAAAAASPDAICYVCHKPGHKARTCPQQPAGSGARGPRCYNCQSYGHVAKDCAAPQQDKAAQACFKCSKKGHFARDCTA